MRTGHPDRPAGGQRAAGAAAALAAAAIIAIPMIERWEGTRLMPYRDLAGIATVCTGETRVEMRRYSLQECRVMLDRAVRSHYGRGVLAAVPALAERPHQLAASISLAYNIGISAFARSTVARRFNHGDWRGGCDAFLMWYHAGGRPVRGLLNRRRDERALCLTGLTP